MKENSKFIHRLYFRALFPNIIAVLGGTVNVFFDGIFIGRKLGDVGLASVNQCLPVYLLLCTIGSLYASGASFLSAHAIGENDKEAGTHFFQGALLDALIVGFGFCLAGFCFSGKLAMLLGTAESYEYVYLYLRITLVGGVSKILLYLPYFYLRLEGKNRHAMAAMLTMTFLNIVLDYCFLYVWDFGIRGAAWASVVATVVAAGMSFAFLFLGKSSFRPGFRVLRISERVAVFRYGSPMAVNNVLSAARILVLNLILGSMGIPGLVSVFAIVNNLNEFSVCIQNGVPQTATAMIGIFHGEKDAKSIRSTVNVELFAGTALSLVMAVFLMLFPAQIGKLFGSGTDCTFAICCLAASLVFATANNVMSYSYNAIGQLAAANTVTVCRAFGAVAAFALIFRGLSEKIWLFYPCVELFTLMLICIGSAWIARQKQLIPFYLIDDALERNGNSTSFTVPCEDGKICEASEKIQSFCEQNHFTQKETMAISLAMEELLTIITHKSCPPEGFIDVRVLAADERRILRIRSGGRRYNPVKAQDESLDYMGVKIICALAQKTEYLSALGVNTLIIYL